VRDGILQSQLLVRFLLCFRFDSPHVATEAWQHDHAPSEGHLKKEAHVMLTLGILAFQYSIPNVSRGVCNELLPFPVGKDKFNF
jgi:hypothetical protein